MKIHTPKTAVTKAKAKNFKARDYARVFTFANGLKDELKIYELEYSDRVFLEKMSSKIKLSELIPDAKEYTRKQLRTWKNIINNSIMMSGCSSPESAFLLTKNKRPCGIISYQDNLNGSIYLDNLATWSNEKGKKVKLAGQTLMKLLFINAENNNIKNIGLSLSSNLKEKGSAFYEKMHFYKSANPNFDMEIFSSDYKEMIEKLEPLIKIKKTECFSERNLGQILDISY